MAPPPQPVRSLLFVCAVITLLALVITAEAQNSTARTDPVEARALNTMFSRWGISADNTWNISGELCSGVAVDATALNSINPGIKCDCSFSRNTTCHITSLRVYALDVPGAIPQELWNLTYLTDLNLGLNNLTGPIPASIRNLARMQYMSLGINALSGNLPQELGQLTDLIILSLSTNYFSGSLPPELGNLSRLEQLYFDSSGVSGPIPSTFANLRSLDTVWGSDNELTGQIPQFIENWSNLRTLRFQGNSFQGPIPSFVGLNSLQHLRISDLLSGTPSLEFLRNMTDLSYLVLRNNGITGQIPSFFNEFHDLTLLDLSFNNLSGTIPDFLFNLASLAYMILGNNSMTGGLPAQKSSSLTAIDLSYNELSGTFPSWINQRNFQINLVANNFVIIKNSYNSALPPGLNCLQRNFPCNRGKPIYSNFAIKCGGEQVTSTNQMIYDGDNETLGPATYYVTNSGRWAVSTAGLYSDSNDPRYKITSPLQNFTYALDPNLFRTARTSPGSLRYYGLGLENGDYTVRLYFVELAIINNRTWQSVGRRVFNIYIQGNLVEPNYDIQGQAGGRILTAVSREYEASVKDNYLEIHLFWAGKGTCCIPLQGSYGPSISAISVTPNFIPSVVNSPTLSPSGKDNHIRLIVGTVVAVSAITFLTLVASCYVHKKKNKRKHFEDEELLGIEARPYTYTYSELKVATDDFNPANKVGEGGFGSVYKGTLSDGRVVAIKQLSVQSHHGKSQFVAEIATISAVQHKNLVKLYGCCIEGNERLLVYEYLDNKSLDRLVFKIGNNSLCLDWPTRFDICLGVARGLSYLHEESRIRIVHRDIKASNILLDYYLTPKISDFGLAKLYDDNKTHLSTKVAGTRGYLAPEYAMFGHLTEKADIFSFGVVILEMISGRPNSLQNSEVDKMYLLEWAWNLHEENRHTELVDSTLNQFDEAVVKRIIDIGLLCTQASPNLRPPMSRVVGMITGDIEVPSVTSRPGYLTDWRFTDASFMNEVIGSSNPNVGGRCIDMSSGTTIMTDPDITLIDDGR